MSFSAGKKDLLRFLTAGSVDDGKSTLIGRLLYESDGVYVDQLDSVRKYTAGKNRPIDLSLLTDGLKAEREQGITIDVAYRYFSTAKRKFIIADTPGHEQYTRNMVTGASTADLALLVLDARKGLLDQTRRHAYIIWLLGIRRIVLAINKMDLVGFDERVFLEIQDAFARSTSFMHGLEKYYVPLSALLGDNVAQRSRNMHWYHGPSLLELLESMPDEEGFHFEDFRFPVQNVIRSNPDFRGYAGQIASGAVEPGQEVIAFPSGRQTAVEKIICYERELEIAVAPQSVLLTLKDYIDLGRGDMLVSPLKPPVASTRFVAELIWMSEQMLKKDAPYLLKHTTRVLCCRVTHLFHKLDVSSFAVNEAEELSINDIGKVEMETHDPMLFDSYSMNRAMGNFIIIDPATNATAAAGMVLEKAASTSWDQPGTGSNRSDPAAGLIVWFTGLSGAGKTTLCNTVCAELLAKGLKVEVLDGDLVRKNLNSDLGFSRKDRNENIYRIGFVAQLLARHGIIVLVAAISPYRSVREELRKSTSNFMEVYVNAPLELCEQRDPKGLYKRARAGEITGFTGIDDPYEPPVMPEVECNTDRERVKASSRKVVSAILARLAPQDHPVAQQKADLP